MTKQIKYSIFCNRKRFNVLEWLDKAEEKSYTAFCAFLASRSVIVPNEDYFNRALNHFVSTHQTNTENVSVENPPVVEELTLPTTQDSVQEVKEEVKPETLEVNIEAVNQPAEEIASEKESSESEKQIEAEPAKEVKKTTRRKRRRKSEDVNNEN